MKIQFDNDEERETLSKVFVYAYNHVCRLGENYSQWTREGFPRDDAFKQSIDEHLNKFRKLDKEIFG